MVDTCFKASPSVDPGDIIIDSLAVGQSIRNGTDERVILFIKLEEGAVFTEELQKRVKAEIRARRSARHVPERASKSYYDEKYC